MSIRKMSSSANQPVCVGRRLSASSTTAVEKAEPGRGEQVLHGPGGEEVDAESPRVERDRACRLVGVREHERSALVGDPRDLGDVEASPGPVGDDGAADERRALVDRLLEALERNRPVVAGRTCTTSAPRELLRVRDLPHSRKLELGDHDPAPPAPLERERGDDTADALGDGRGDGDLVRLGADEPRERRAGSFRALDPVLPFRAVRVPAVEVGARRPRGRRSESAPCEHELT